ncbi:MAG TPA: hypothetical protein PLF23_12705, partial [Candidatus Obscuribacter sp.]|nr:hypothetical protein [Candidatus Obscuribacter sp.]
RAAPLRSVTFAHRCPLARCILSFQFSKAPFNDETLTLTNICHEREAHHHISKVLEAAKPPKRPPIDRLAI